MQPGVFQQAAQATGNLMKSVAGAADTVQALYNRAQDLKNDTDISTKRRIIRESQGEFQNRMLAEGVEPALWGSEWKKTLVKVTKDLKLGEAPPVVQRSVQKIFDDFKGTSSIQISGAALKENLKRARQNYDRDYEYNRSIGDHEGNFQLIKDSTGKLLSDDEASDATRMTTMLQNQDNMVRSLADDAGGHMERVKAGEFGPLSKPDMVREEIKTDTQIKRNTAETLSMIEMDMQNGRISNEEELREALERENVPSKTARAVISNYNKVKPLTRTETNLISDQFDALVELRLKPEQYENAYYGLQTLIGVYGERGGIGQFKSDIFNVRPSRFSAEEIAKMTAKQRVEALKPLQTSANNLVKIRASGYATRGYAKGRATGTELTREELEANAVLETEMKERGERVRFELQEGVNGFIIDFEAEHGRKPTMVDVTEYMDKEGDALALKANNPDFNAPTSEGTTSAQEAANWLNTAGDSILPVKTLTAQATRYGYEGDKYQSQKATTKGSKYENVGNRNNLLKKGVSVALPPATAKKLGINLKSGEYVEAKIGGKWQRFRVDDTTAKHKNDRIDFFDPDGTRIKIDGKQIEIRKSPKQ